MPKLNKKKIEAKIAAEEKAKKAVEKELDTLDKTLDKINKRQDKLNARISRHEDNIRDLNGRLHDAAA